MDPSLITFAALITPPGIITAGGFASVLVQIVKGVFPTLDAKVSGALQALFFTSVLYLFTGIVLASNGTITSPDGALWVFTAWLTCAASAIGIKAGFTHAVNAPGKGQPLTDAVDVSLDLKVNPSDPLTDPAIGEDSPRYPS